MDGLTHRPANGRIDQRRSGLIFDRRQFPRLFVLVDQLAQLIRLEGDHLPVGILTQADVRVWVPAGSPEPGPWNPETGRQWSARYPIARFRSAHRPFWIALL